MKQIELELNKRLLIVESDSTMVEGQYEADVNGRHIELICKGYELTEEIAKELVKNEISDYLVEWAYDYKSKQQLNLDHFSCQESFISAIESKGYYWGENPYSNYKSYSEEHLKASEELFKQAESKTFNPEKTLIFEIQP